MMKFSSLFYCLLLTIFIILIRHYVLKHYPGIIINGYFCIFLIMFILSYVFTKDTYFSLFIAVIIVYGRVLYRKYIGEENLKDSNHSYHLIIFIIGLFLVFLSLYHYSFLEKKKKYYSFILFFIILGILYNLKYSNTDCCLP